MRPRRSPAHAIEVMQGAAAAVFVRKGYHGASMDDIAAEAGYSPAAVYKYFRNKEELYTQLWTAVAKRLEDVFAEVERLDTPFAQRLRWLVTRIGLLLEERPDPVLAFLMHRPYRVREPSAFEKLAIRHYQREMKSAAKLMSAGVSEGALRPGDPEDYATLLVGLLVEFAIRTSVDARPLDVPRQVDRLLDLFLRGAGSSPTNGS